MTHATHHQRSTPHNEASEIVQAELDRLAAAFAEHPGWTSADFEAEREAEHQAQAELAGQLREWRTATRRRNARQARHHPWN